MAPERSTHDYINFEATSKIYGLNFTTLTKKDRFERQLVKAQFPFAPTPAVRHGNGIRYYTAQNCARDVTQTVPADGSEGIHL